MSILDVRRRFLDRRGADGLAEGQILDFLRLG
jgi:hypothetical protein